MWRELTLYSIGARSREFCALVKPLSLCIERIEYVSECEAFLREMSPILPLLYTLEIHFGTVYCIPLALMDALCDFQELRVLKLVCGHVMIPSTVGFMGHMILPHLHTFSVIENQLTIDRNIRVLFRDGCSVMPLRHVRLVCYWSDLLEERNVWPELRTVTYRAWSDTLETMSLRGRSLDILNIDTRFFTDDAHLWTEVSQSDVRHMFVVAHGPIKLQHRYNHSLKLKSLTINVANSACNIDIDFETVAGVGRLDFHGFSRSFLTFTRVPDIQKFTAFATHRLTCQDVIVRLEM